MPLAFTNGGYDNQPMARITKQQTNLIETQVDDELVVVSLANGEFYSLKDTGLAIWEAIDGQRDEASLVNLLQDKFDAPQEQIAKDVRAFLADLAQNGFVERQ